MKGIDSDKALQNYCSNFERYNDWDGFSVIYIPQFDSRKERGYCNDYVTNREKGGQIEYSRAATPPIRQTGNRLSGQAGTA